jgi:hypothetical protein
VPLLVGQALEVRGSSECRDSAEQFARADGDVQRQSVEQLRTGIGVQAVGDVSLESGDGQKRLKTERLRITTTQAGFPIWVLRVDLTLGRSLPVYPDDRTSADRAGRSVSCQQRKSGSPPTRSNR